LKADDKKIRVLSKEINIISAIMWHYVNVEVLLIITKVIWSF